MQPSTEPCRWCKGQVDRSQSYGNNKKYCCQSCRVSASRSERRKRDPVFRASESAYLVEQVRKRKKSSPEGWLEATIRSVKSRARIRGIPFDLSIEDVKIPLRCPVLGVPLRYLSDDPSSNGQHADSPQLDRIIPEKGYVKGNTRIICARANKLKNNASLEEAAALFLDALSTRNCDEFEKIAMMVKKALTNMVNDE